MTYLFKYFVLYNSVLVRWSDLSIIQLTEVTTYGPLDTASIFNTTLSSEKL